MKLLDLDFDSSQQLLNALRDNDDLHISKFKVDDVIDQQQVPSPGSALSVTATAATTTTTNTTNFCFSDQVSVF